MDSAPSSQTLAAKVRDLLPETLLNEREAVVLAFKPSLWIIAFFSFRLTLLAMTLAVATMFYGAAVGLGAWTATIIWSCGGMILARIVFAYLQWASRAYVLTEKRVIRVAGVFNIDIFQCDLAKVQNTFLVLTLMQRPLRLGHIAFTTAGTGAVEAVWRYCRNPLEIHHKIIHTLENVSVDEDKVL